MSSGRSAAAGETPETRAEEGPELAFDASKPFSDVYADSVQVSIGPFGIVLTFGLSDPQQASYRQVVGRVRMSPQLAFVTTQLLRKVLRKGADDGMSFSVPDEITRSLELEKDL